MAKKTKATAAAQEAAAADTTTVAQTAPTPQAPAAENAEGVTEEKVKRVKSKFPPLKRQPKAPKVAKESKRITGPTIHIATTSYNYWREWINRLINGEEKEEAMKAKFVRDLTAQDNAKWGGYISAAPEHKDAVLATLRTWDTENHAKPEKEQFVEMWSILDTFQEVAPKARKPRAKKEAAVENAEVA